LGLVVACLHLRSETIRPVSDPIIVTCSHNCPEPNSHHVIGRRRPIPRPSAEEVCPLPSCCPTLVMLMHAVGTAHWHAAAMEHRRGANFTPARWTRPAASRGRHWLQGWRAEHRLVASEKETMQGTHYKHNRVWHWLTVSNTGCCDGMVLAVIHAAKCAASHHWAHVPHRCCAQSCGRLPAVRPRQAIHRCPYTGVTQGHPPGAASTLDPNELLVRPASTSSVTTSNHEQNEHKASTTVKTLILRRICQPQCSGTKY
jgi:hypothetical protein